jgi:hypothetical protein
LFCRENCANKRLLTVAREVAAWLAFNQVALKQLANRASVRHFPKLPALVFAQFISLIEIHVAAKT